MAELHSTAMHNNAKNWWEQCAVMSPFSNPLFKLLTTVEGAVGGVEGSRYILFNKLDNLKIPHTGDTESLDRCG